MAPSGVRISSCCSMIVLKVAMTPQSCGRDSFDFYGDWLNITRATAPFLNRIHDETIFAAPIIGDAILSAS